MMVYEFMPHEEWMWLCEFMSASGRARSSNNIEKYVLLQYFQPRSTRVEEFIGVNASGEFSWIVSCAWALWLARVSCDFNPLHQQTICAYIRLWTRLVLSTQSSPALHTDTTKLCAFSKSNAKPVFLRRFFFFLQKIIFSHSKCDRFGLLFAHFIIILISNGFWLWISVSVLQMLIPLLLLSAAAAAAAAASSTHSILNRLTPIFSTHSFSVSGPISKRWAPCAVE